MRIIDTLPTFNDSVEVKKILAETLLNQKQITSLDEFPSPFEMLDMQKAVDVFFDAVANNKKIKCVCDSDCDGLGTYTLFYNFFKYFPYKNIEIIITDRKQGYGFLPRHIDDNTGLYITSDNGITSNEATSLAKSKGAQVIITDHHQPDLEKGLPDADAIVDPFIPGDTFPYKDISGTFVLWFFLKAIAEKSNLQLDLFEEFLPELGLTTLSDVMPVDRHLNRFVVEKFTEMFGKDISSHREYVNTFRELENANPTAEDISFGLTPMINATQRMTTADHGAMFMIQETSEKSKEWFYFVKQLNDNRKEIQLNLLEYIELHYKDYIEDKAFIVIPGRFHDTYKGVAGIVAARIADKHGKPTLILKYNPDTKEYSGSGRSVGNINILDVLRANNYVKNVGGHKQALGATITEDNWDNFYTTLQEYTSKIPAEEFLSSIKPLGFIPLNKLDLDMYHDIQEFEPFGKEFPRPIFATKAIVKNARLVGKQKNHLSLTVTDSQKLIQFKAMQFFTSDVPIKGEEYLIYFKMGLDTFSGIPKLMFKIESMEIIPSE